MTSRFSVYWGLAPDNRVYQIDDLQVWAQHMDDLLRSRRRHIGDDVIDGKRVSTVFLGIDHNFAGGPPILFETMIFPSPDVPMNEYMERYSTWQEAKDGHARVCDMVRGRVGCEAITDEEKLL